MSEQAAFHTYMYTPCHISKNILLHKPQQQLEVFFYRNAFKTNIKKSMYMMYICRKKKTLIFAAAAAML